MPIWVTGRIIENIHWTNKLFSLLIHAPINPFLAGQFTKIKLAINGKNIQRAYSYLNPPISKYLTFYLVTIPTGKLTPHLYNMKQGDTLQLTQKPYGHFTLNKIPNCKHLWMIATSTGIAPFLSILTNKTGLEKFTHIVLIYAVRFLQDLNYLNIINIIKKKYHNKFKIQIILSQEKSFHTLTGHIQDLISNGLLEKKIGLRLEPKNSHIMLCGNPNMIYETKKVLENKYNMHIHSNVHPGHITIERYW